MTRGPCTHALVVALVATGCLRDTEFHCTSNMECGTDGQCEVNGFCSVPDSNCIDGRRYTSYSGSLTNQCVMSDAGVPDAGMPVEAGMGCAPGFLALPGVTGHLYFAVTTPAPFTTQRDACAALGGITYLAIPDDMTELAALVALQAQPGIWVGIDDQIVTGTYQTVRGQPATYLPWAAGQPTNTALTQCVEALAMDTYQDQRCATTLRAVCECEP